MSDRAGKLAAVDTNLDQSFQEIARKLAVEHVDINDEDDSKWPHNLRTSRSDVPHLEKVYSNLRQLLERKQEDKMENFDVNTFVLGMCMIVTQQAAVHLGNDFFDNLHATKNQPQRTMKQLFDVTSKRRIFR